MQKPQQRKYHSSCNRSVHRGTAHGKQEVKVCKRKTPHLLVRSFFVPLRGWYLQSKRVRVQRRVFAPLRGWYKSGMNGLETRTCFRPLTGIVPFKINLNALVRMFSSPYGDGTSNNQPAETGHQVFAPLRGWYVCRKTRIKYHRFSPPLRGWYNGTAVLRSAGTVFAPLRGWYARHIGGGKGGEVFAPLQREKAHGMRIVKQET